MKKATIFFLLIILGARCYSQKKATSIQQIWIGNTSQLRFSQKWGASFDLQIRSRGKFFNGLSQVSSRIGLVYLPNESLRLAAGYYFANNIPRDYHNAIFQIEHTGWQQVSWSNKFPRLNINQSVRLEERFRHRVKNEFELGEGYSFNYRTRYNILFNLALSRLAFAPHSFSAVLYNEVYLNFGKQIIYNTFDQFRTYAGLNFALSKKANLQFGYMYAFQQLAAGNRYRHLHAARIFYLYNLDLRRKKNSPVKDAHDVS